MQAQGKTFKNSVEFLNCTKDKFEWENDDIPRYKTTGKKKNIIHLTINAKISGLVVEEEFEDVAEAIIETTGPTDKERANAARDNAGISNTTGVS